MHLTSKSKTMQMLLKKFQIDEKEGISLYFMCKAYSPFLHYLLFPSIHIINIGNTGNQTPLRKNNPRVVWFSVFPILISVSWEPVDNEKMANKQMLHPAFKMIVAI